MLHATLPLKQLHKRHCCCANICDVPNVFCEIEYSKITLFYIFWILAILRCTVDHKNRKGLAGSCLRFSDIISVVISVKIRIGKDVKMTYSPE